MALLKEICKIPELPKRLWDKMQNHMIWWLNTKIKGYCIEHRTFIVGCGHSGTSLLLAIIGSHPNIYAVPFESRAFGRRARKNKYLLKSFDNKAISKGKRHWIEKTPKHIHNIEKILTILPDARIILIIRDGRDVAMSIKARFHDFEKGIMRWIKDNRAGQHFWNHPQVLKVKYEDIIEDFHTTISLILNFIGETYTSDVEHFHNKPKKYYSNIISKPERVYGKNHGQYRNWQLNQKLFDGRGRWKYEMSKKEKAVFKSLAGPMLVEYGYVGDDEW